MSTVIILYSKHGTVIKCANQLNEKLTEKAKIYNLKDTKDIPLEMVDTIVFGTSFYMGSIAKEMKNFLKKNKSEISQKKNYLFFCGIQEEMETEIQTNFDADFLKKVQKAENLGGEIQFQKLNFLEKTIMKMVMKSKEDVHMLKEDKILELAKCINQ